MKLRARVEAQHMGEHGVWLGFEDFDVPPQVPLLGEFVELFDPTWDTLWVGRIDTVNYQRRLVFVQCDWREGN